MLTKISFICFILITLNANNKEKNYSEIFHYMEENGIVLANDITMEKLFVMIESGEIYDRNGNINNKILKMKLDKLINIKNESFSKIRKEISKNPNNKINKEVKKYLDESNDIVEEKKQELKNDENLWQSNIINYVLDLMKF